MTARVYPIPAGNYFNVRVEGSSNNPVQLRVIDIYGRVVERKDNLSVDQVSRIGTACKPGLYILAVIQGNKRVQQKLLKINE